MLLFSVLSIRGTTSKDVSFTDIERTFEDYETMKGLRIGGKDDAERRYGISFSERGNCYIRYSEVLLNVTEFAIIYEPNQDTRYIQEDKLNEYLQELKNKFNNYYREKKKRGDENGTSQLHKMTQRQDRK